jgi:hypothetical protein
MVASRIVASHIVASHTAASRSLASRSGSSVDRTALGRRNAHTRNVPMHSHNRRGVPMTSQAWYFSIVPPGRARTGAPIAEPEESHPWRRKS